MYKSRHIAHWRLVVRPLAQLLPTLFPLFTLLIALLVSTPTWADPPGRIGRVAWLSQTGGLMLDNRSRGESFRPPVNQPLTSGDVLSTDGNARAEIQIGSMTLRLDAGTSLELTRVDDEQVSAFLRNGSSIVRLTSPETAREFELNTPNGRVTANVSPGDSAIFRVDANDNGSSATAYFVSLRFSANDADIDIRAGERADVWYAGQTRYRLATPASDDFTRWSAARDQRPAAGASSRYVSPEMTGADDLDAWGDWSETPEYGALWTPRSVAVDWAPYRSGHWVWVAPWDWSWVGHEPWGFAPFHYGRWVQHRGRWGWVPGAYLARPVYAPAMVAWTPAPGITIAFSSARPPTSGWFPLAPREVYVPFYRSSPDYVRRVNRTHVAHIDNVIIGNPHEAARQQRYAHRDPPRTEASRSFVHTPHGNRDWRDAADRRRDDKRHEVREKRDERRVEDRRQAGLQAPARAQHPDMAFFQMGQSAKTTRHEASAAEQRAPGRMERRPDTPHRALPEDDRRKRHLRPSNDKNDARR